MRFFAFVTMVLSVGCGPEVDPRCAPEATTALYDRRIRPLLEEDRPKSCNQCHLSGIDLEAFVKETPCDTMACMVNRGIVDLAAPDQSLILGWIDRAAPESEGITADVIAEERQGFLEWIEHTADCGPCASVEEACGPSPSYMDCDVRETQGVPYDDPGDCSDQTLEALFLNGFYAARGRCLPCHQANGGIPEAPPWMVLGDCEIGSVETMRSIVRREYIDFDDPRQSLWLLKPLAEDLGGVEHGGGTKIHSMDEGLWQGMTRWVDRYTECRSP
jgi:hypothetical protein